jgi:hypothetical protein
MMEILQSRTYDGADPIRVAAFPQSSSPFLWKGVVETPSAWHVYAMNALIGTFDPEVGRTLYKPETNAAIAAASNTPTFREFEEFAQYPLWQSVPSADVENGTQVDLIDLRFPFHSRAIIDNQNRVRRSEYPVYGW